MTRDLLAVLQKDLLKQPCSAWLAIVAQQLKNLPQSRAPVWRRGGLYSPGRPRHEVTAVCRPVSLWCVFSLSRHMLGLKPQLCTLTQSTVVASCVCPVKHVSGFVGCAHSLVSPESGCVSLQRPEAWPSPLTALQPVFEGSSVSVPTPLVVHSPMCHRRAHHMAFSNTICTVDCHVCR